MNRNNFPRRLTALPTQFVRQYNQDSDLKSAVSTGEEPCLRRRIFIIQKANLLPATGGQVKSVQHILVLDDHPDSLRLILEPPANRNARNRAELRNLILSGTGILAALVGIVWFLI